MRVPKLSGKWIATVTGSLALIVAVLLALAGTGSGSTPPNGNVAVDCNAATAGVQANCAYPVGATFSIQVNVGKVPAGGFYGYQMKVRWTTATLDYIPNEDLSLENLWSNCDFPARFNNEPGGPPNDPTGSAAVVFGCAQGDNPRVPHNTAGPILMLQFQCVAGANGISSVTLVPRPGDLQAGSHFLDVDDNTIDPNVVAANVTCGTPPPATSTITNTPANTATPTNTGPPTNTPTDTPTATITNTPTITPTSTDTGTPTNTPLPLPTLTATPPKLPSPGDGDLDGCADVEENGPDPVQGGQRNYTSFWDFFDVPVPPNYKRDKVISIADIHAVVVRFGTQRATPPTKQEAQAEALVPPSSMSPPSYHAAYDRTFTGPQPWHSGPPNGSISIADINLIVQQFGHSCASPP